MFVTLNLKVNFAFNFTFMIPNSTLLIITLYKLKKITLLRNIWVENLLEMISKFSRKKSPISDSTRC